VAPFLFGPLSTDAATTLAHPENDGLVEEPTLLMPLRSRRRGGACARPTADECLVYLDLARHHEAVALHGEPDALKHEPR